MDQVVERILNVFGTEVIERDISSQRVGCLDAEEYRLATMPRQDHGLSVEGIRRSTGWPNRNIHDAELLTDLVTINVGSRTVRLWIYWPRQPFDSPHRQAIVYAHGGAFIAGSPFTDESLCRYMAQACNAVVFNVDYALAPEAPYPAAIEDLCAALEYVYANAENHGADRDRIAVSGDSAGAMLMLCAVLRGAHRFVHYQAYFYPCTTLDYENIPVPWNISMFEMAEEQRRMIEPRLNLGRSDGGGDPRYLMMLRSLYLMAGGDPRSADVSPIYGDLSVLPTTRLFTCEYDGLRPQGEYFGMQLKNAGVEARVVRYRHIFHAFTEKIGHLPHAKDAVDLIAEDLRGLE